jgi:hypothetical protein
MPAAIAVSPGSSGTAAARPWSVSKFRDMGVVRECRRRIIYPAAHADSTRRAGLPDHDDQPGRGCPAGQNAFGMLMVDTLEAGGVRRADVPLIRLLAGLLADALAQA